MKRTLHTTKQKAMLLAMLLVAAGAAMGQNEEPLSPRPKIEAWPMPGAKWTYCLYTELGEPYDKEVWQITGDSLIGNKVYNIIHPIDSTGQPVSNSGKTLLTRYENDTVYRYVNDKEYLFFSFGLSESDVFTTFRSAGWGANGVLNYGNDSACCSAKPLLVMQKREVELGGLVLNEYVLKDTLFSSIYGHESEQMYWRMIDRIGPVGTYPFIDLKETGFANGSGACVYQTCHPYALLSAYQDDGFEQIWFECHPTSVEEDIKEKEFGAYPNPTDGVVRIEGIDVSEIFVYNSLGNKVKVIQNSNVFNTGCLPRGLYLLKIIDNKNDSFTTKIIVI